MKRVFLSILFLSLLFQSNVTQAQALEILLELKSKSIEIAQQEVFFDESRGIVLEEKLSANQKQEGTFTLEKKEEWIIVEVQFSGKPKSKGKFYLTDANHNQKIVSFNENRRQIVKDLSQGTYQWKWDAFPSPTVLKVKYGALRWTEGLMVLLPDEHYSEKDILLIKQWGENGRESLNMGQNELAHEYGIFFEDANLHRDFIQMDGNERRILFKEGESIKTINWDENQAPQCTQVTDLRIQDAVLFTTLYCQTPHGKTQKLFFMSESFLKLNAEDRKPILGIIKDRMDPQFGEELEQSDFDDKDEESLTFKKIKEWYPATIAVLKTIGIVLSSLIAAVGILITIGRLLQSYRRALKKIARTMVEGWEKYKGEIIQSGLLPLAIVIAGGMLLYGEWPESTRFIQDFKGLPMKEQLWWIFIAVGSGVILFNQKTRMHVWNRLLVFKSKVPQFISRKSVYRMVQIWIVFLLVFFVSLFAEIKIAQDSIVLGIIFLGIAILISTEWGNLGSIESEEEKIEWQRLLHMVRITPIFLGLTVVIFMNIFHSFEVHEKLNFGETSAEALAKAEQTSLKTGGIEGRNWEDYSQQLNTPAGATRLFSNEGFEIQIPIAKRFMNKPYRLTLKGKIKSNDPVTIDVLQGNLDGKKALFNPQLKKFNLVGEFSEKKVSLYRRKEAKVLKSLEEKLPKDSHVAIEAKNFVFEKPLRQKENKVVLKAKKWSPHIKVENQIFETYISAKKGLEMNMEIRTLEAGDFQPLIVEITNRGGEKRFQEGTVLQGSKERLIEFHWAFPDLNAGVYSLKFTNPNKKIPYQIQRMQANTDHWVIEGPFTLLKGSKVWFKNWSNALEFQGNQGAAFKGEIISDQGKKVNAPGEIRVDDNTVWSMETLGEGKWKDSFRNLYSFAPESWFNPFDYTVTERMTEQTDYAFLEDQYGQITIDENGYATIESVLEGLVGGDEINPVVRIQIDFEQNNLNNWMEVKDWTIEFETGRSFKN